MNSAAPNNALQRTRVRPSVGRSPLSFETFGGRGLVVALLALGTNACVSSPCRNIVPPVPIQQTGPNVPNEFWSSHKDGTVTLQMWIESEGSVTEPRVVTSPGHDYSVLALEAVKKWRYQPALCDGHPIRLDLTVTMRFSHE